MSKNKSNITVPKIVVSLIFFMLFWVVVTDTWGTSQLIFGKDITVTQKYIFDMLSRVLWILPVFYLFKRYRNDLPLSLSEIFKFRINVKVFLSYFVIFTLYAFAVMFLNFGEVHINPEFSIIRHISFFLVVGFVEELVYRGWGMNALSAFMSTRKANVISSIFFVVLHWPAYAIKFFMFGEVAFSAFIMQSVVVFVVGILFGHMFNISKSIWTSILLHAYFDILGVLLTA